MHRVYFFAPILVLTCTYAILRGGKPERYAAWWQLIAGLLTPILTPPIFVGVFDVVPLSTFLIDVLLCVALWWLAVRADRYWPILLAGFQLVSVAGHVVRFLDPKMLRFGYAFLEAFWAYPMLLTMVVGTWLHRRRLRTLGTDPPWRGSSAASTSKPQRMPRAD